MVPPLDHALNALAFLHRWLGIGGGALFVLWFASGVVTMYVRMPEVTPEERLARARPLDPAWLARRRPLWDITAIGLSLGGLALALTSATPGWRRVQRMIDRRDRAAARRVLE